MIFGWAFYSPGKLTVFAGPKPAGYIPIDHGRTRTWNRVTMNSLMETLEIQAGEEAVWKNWCLS
jgi:hypothetical protein